MVFATIAAFKLGVSPNLAAYETKTPQREGGSRRGVQMIMRRELLALLRRNQVEQIFVQQLSLLVGDVVQ